MEQINEELVKTGTTTIGIKCKDGIVLAADRRATAGHFIADKRAEKLHQVDDGIALTIAGLVSDAQLLVKLIRAELKLKKVRTNTGITVKEATNLLASMTYSNIRRMSMVPGIVGFLVGGVDAHGFSLYEIGIDGSISEAPDFVADGSGSVFAYGVLETLYKKDITVDEGLQLAIKSVNAALQRDAATGNGIDIMTITKDGVKRAYRKEIETRIE
ncbi:proteasome subunit beta [Candidatus Woesearchaeota archaeon]|nr:proteasome subunit beta [Candidatus Woesearchaeota archaeon]